MHRDVHDDGGMDSIRYVAIGDSFSEGIGDTGDGTTAGTPTLPGWTGRLATGIAALLIHGTRLLLLDRTLDKMAADARVDAPTQGAAA